ncbi:MAG: calcium/sodium antiporter [Gammaproteobacteria bacterium]|nr:calcium/sodium antiporter [Gammaproteobacteria bacterium]
MLVATLIIIIGFIGLIWGAERFVSGASSIAENFGISPLIIGLTIVAFGTSAPEFFSSAAAAYQQKPGLAIGNALGSNLFNIGVALGVAAIINPLRPPKSLSTREIPALLLVTLVTGVLLTNFYVGFLDALVLLFITAFLGYKLLSYELSNATDLSNHSIEEPKSEVKRIGSIKALLYLTMGLLILVISAEALVQAASNIASRVGVSETIIGLTIIALGTSLPELAAAVTAVLKGHEDLAIGNIVGSNILNFLIVLPFPGLFAPGMIEKSLVYRDFLTVLILTVLLSLICYRCIRHKGKITRIHGVLFLLIYSGWFTFMLLEVQS